VPTETQVPSGAGRKRQKTAKPGFSGSGGRQAGDKNGKKPQELPPWGWTREKFCCNI